MAIVDLQRGIAEAGRIRIGQKVPSRNGTRPSKLDTFRLTSADRRRIDQAAEVYGGTVSEWDAPAGKQWQVITGTDVLEVIVPPTDLGFSQYYELWSAGGCQRRCDGVNEQLSQGPCRCDPDQRECDVHTRLSVLLRDLTGLGVWRLDTQGWYAARELASAVEIIQIAAGRGALLPARLRLEQRSVKRPGENGKPETRRFAVPVLDVEISPAQLLAGGATPIPLEQAARPPLTPVPALPGPSIAEQSEPPAPRASRANSATEIPSSGRSRRSRATTEQPTADDGPQRSGADPGTAAVSRSAPPPVSQPEAGDSPPVAAPPARPPIDVMVDLIGAAGKDPDEIRSKLGYERWEDAPPDVIARLTTKAQEALLDQAETVATAPTEAAKPARRSRSKKES